MSGIEMNPFIRYLNVSPMLRTYNPFSVSYDCRIFLVLNGTVSFKLAKTEHVLNKNTLIYIPAGTKYAIGYPEGILYDILVINFDFTKKYSEITKLVPVHANSFESEKLLDDTIPQNFTEVFVCECNTSLMNNFMTMYHGSLSNSLYSEEKISALLKYNLCSMYEDVKYNDNRVSSVLISEVEQHILRNYSDSNMSNVTLAEKFGYHPNYLNSIFKKALGITLHQHILDLRIDLAKELLKNTNSTITEVAFQVGFSSSSYFSQIFTKFQGCSPNQYRAKRKTN